MSITKLSDVRVSSISELQTFLKEKGIPFETDSNKPRLQELARGVFQPTPPSTPADEQNPEAEGQGSQEQPEAPEEKQADEQPKEPETAPESNQAPEQPVVETAPVDAPKDTPKEPKAPAKAKERKESEDERDTRLATPAGSRRELPLEELLNELARKGFNNKQEIADFLEATVRETRRLADHQTEFNRRDKALEDGEIKLSQRIADFEVTAKKIHVDKEEAQNILEQAVKIQQNIERAGKNR